MTGTFPEQYVSYLHDESRLSGRAEGIVFPASEPEVIDVVRRCAAEKIPVTIQGARTGLVGGAVPVTGMVVNLSAMDRPLSLRREAGGDFLLEVQPGYLLSSLRRDLIRGKFDWLEPETVDPETIGAFKEAGEQFWPPDPSELTATLGGIAATNGRGPGAFRYGSASEYIQALRLVRSDGQAYELARGDELLEQVLGGEGMYGAITSLTLRLRLKPAEMWGIAFFFPTEEGAAAFIDRAAVSGLISLSVLDFLDRKSLEMVRDLKRVAAKLREISDAPEGAGAAVFLELHADSEDEIEEAAQVLMEIAEELESDPDESWALSGDEIEKLRLFRHAVPESVNTRLDHIRLSYPAATKLAADMTVPGATLTETLTRYRRDIAQAGIEAVVFGHGGENHLHVNFLPANDDERQRVEALMLAWLMTARERGGLLFREHGIGKVKKELFMKAEAQDTIGARRRLKQALDPEEFWNPGNIF